MRETSICRPASIRSPESIVNIKVGHFNVHRPILTFQYACPNSWTAIPNSPGGFPNVWMTTLTTQGAFPKRWMAILTSLGDFPNDWMTVLTTQGAFPKSWMTILTSQGAFPNVWTVILTTQKVSTARRWFGMAGGPHPFPKESATAHFSPSGTRVKVSSAHPKRSLRRHKWVAGICAVPSSQRW